MNLAFEAFRLFASQVLSSYHVSQWLVRYSHLGMDQDKHA